MQSKLTVKLVLSNDSGGARIQEGVESLAGYADIFLVASNLILIDIIFVEKCPIIWCHPSDFNDYGPMRRWRRIFSCFDGFHIYG